MKIIFNENVKLKISILYMKKIFILYQRHKIKNKLHQMISKFQLCVFMQ